MACQVMKPKGKCGPINNVKCETFDVCKYTRNRAIVEAVSYYLGSIVSPNDNKLKGYISLLG